MTLSASLRATALLLLAGCAAHQVAPGHAPFASGPSVLLEDLTWQESLSLNTARDMIVDICRSLAHHGPRGIYILNTGVSTLNPLRAAQANEARGVDILGEWNLG